MREGSNSGGSAIRLAIFDLDGTITRPNLDFKRIKHAVGLDDPEVLLLDYILSLPQERRRRAFEIVDSFEEEAARSAELRKGAAALLRRLRRRGIKVAIFTRNSRKSVRTVLDRFRLEVDAVISREDGPPKPEPDALVALLRRLGLRPCEAIMVGDFGIDVIAGRRAGIRTVLLDSGERAVEAEPDERIESLPQLLELIDRWQPDSRS